MLQDMWIDVVFKSEEEEATIESEMKQKKIGLQTTKKANVAHAEQLRELVLSIEQGAAGLKERVSTLQVQMGETEEACAAADELRAKTVAHEASVATAHTQLAEAEAALERAHRERDALTKQLEACHSETVTETQRGAAVAAEGDAKATQLAAMQAEAEAAAGESSERASWYAQVTGIVGRLAGIVQVTADGSSATYTFAAGTGGVDGCALVVRFDVGSGALLGASIRPDGLLAIDDLEAHAVRSNSLSFLVREVQARLDGVDGAAAYVPPGQASGAAASFRLAAALLPPAAASLVPPPTPGLGAGYPTPVVALHAASSAVMPPPATMPSAGGAAPFSQAKAPFSQAKIIEYPPPHALSAAAAAAAAALPPSFASTPAAAGLASATAAAPPTPFEALPVENLDARMSLMMPSPKPTPKPTPGGWSRAGGGPSSAARVAVADDAGAPSATAFRRSEVLARTPAQPKPPTPGPTGRWSVGGGAPPPASNPQTRAPAPPPAVPGSALADTVPRADYALDGAADTVPRAEYGPPASASGAAAASVAPLPLALPLGMRLEDVDARRSSRRSFCRSVSQPRSPAARAAFGAEAMDARRLIATLVEEPAAETDFEVHDMLGRLRATVRQDGLVVAPDGSALFEVEAASGRVGAVNENSDFIGKVCDVMPNSSVAAICRDDFTKTPEEAPDVDDALMPIAELDYGTSTIRDLQGSTIASISRAGEVNDHFGARRGVLEGFTFQALKTAAQYLILVDRDFLGLPPLPRPLPPLAE